MNREQRENRIKEVFLENYRDLGIYRWMNRNKKDIKKYFAISFVVSVIYAFTFSTVLIGIWGVAFIGLIWAGAIDHFIIGRRMNKMISILKNEGIDVGLSKLLFVCSDIIPK